MGLGVCELPLSAGADSMGGENAQEAATPPSSDVSLSAENVLSASRSKIALTICGKQQQSVDLM